MKMTDQTGVNQYFTEKGGKNLLDAFKNSKHLAWVIACRQNAHLL